MQIIDLDIGKHFYELVDSKGQIKLTTVRKEELNFNKKIHLKFWNYEKNLYTVKPRFSKVSHLEQFGSQIAFQNEVSSKAEVTLKTV